MPERGHDDYITKPVDLKVLAEKLQQWLTPASAPNRELRDGESPAQARVRIDAAVIEELCEVSKRCGYDVLRRRRRCFCRRSAARRGPARQRRGPRPGSRGRDRTSVEGRRRMRRHYRRAGTMRADPGEFEQRSFRPDGAEALLNDIESEVLGARATLLGNTPHDEEPSA